MINKVIVAGCQHGGLAAIRSLGRRGLHVIGLSFDSRQFGLFSRYTGERVLCPHPEDTRAFADFLLARSDEWNGALILETNDYFTTAISRHKDELQKHYRLITPDWDHAQLFIEKDKTYQLADICGVPHPGLYQINSMDELDAMEKDLVFPVMIKPVRSHEFTAFYNKKLFIIENVHDLRRMFQDTIDHRLEVMIQEIIPGTDEGTLESIELYIDTAGNITGEQFNVKLRQSPPMFGIMSVGKSVAPIADLRDYALRMLQQIDYRGYASFEFKRDVRDGLPKLIEVNIRQPRNCQLLIASGVDLPWLAYQDVMLGKSEAQTEASSLYFVDFPADVAGAFKNDFLRIVKLRKFIAPYLSADKTFAIFARDDPWPFFKLIEARVIGAINGMLTGKRRAAT